MKAILKISMWLLIIIAAVFLLEVLGLLKIKHDISGYKKYWQKQNQKPLQPTELLYVALGDSTAQGLGATRPTKGYVGLLAAQLAQQSGKKVHIVNLSVSGAKIQDVLDTQLPELNKLPIDASTVVTMEIGANDLGSFEPEVLQKQMDEVMSQLPKQTVVSDMPYFGGGRHKDREPQALAATIIIADLAMQHSLRLAPLHAVTKQKSSIFNDAADFFHPSNRGYRNWYEAFRRGLGW